MLVFPQPFLKWRGREGEWVGGVRGWNIGLHCWRLRPALLCAVDESKRGGEGKLEWESEVTEFIRSVGSEPWTCLWVSVAVPVHVFSLSSGRPHSPQSLCQSSLIVSALSSWFRFFVLCPSCDCLQTCFRPSQGNLSLDLMVIKERLPWRMAYLTPSLSCWPLSLPFVAHICMLCQYHKFSPSSISPALRSTKGLKYYPLCGLFIQGCLTKRWVCTSFLKIFEATVYTTWHKGKVSSWCESFSSVFLSRGLSEPLFTELLCCLKPKQCSAVRNRALCITEIKWYFMVSDSEVGKKGRL